MPFPIRSHRTTYDQPLPTAGSTSDRCIVKAKGYASTCKEALSPHAMIDAQAWPGLGLACALVLGYPASSPVLKDKTKRKRIHGFFFISFDPLHNRHLQHPPSCQQPLWFGYLGLAFCEVTSKVRKEGPYGGERVDWVAKLSYICRFPAHR